MLNLKEELKIGWWWWLDSKIPCLKLKWWMLRRKMWDENDATNLPDFLTSFFLTSGFLQTTHFDKTPTSEEMRKAYFWLASLHYQSKDEEEKLSLRSLSRSLPDVEVFDQVIPSNYKRNQIKKMKKRMRKNLKRFWWFLRISKVLDRICTDEDTRATKSKRIIFISLSSTIFFYE